MLYELLAGQHPYWSEDQAEYARLVRGLRGRSRLRCSGRCRRRRSNAEVSAALHRCLSPDPAARPTAAELRAVLSGRDRKPAVAADGLAAPADAARCCGPPRREAAGAAGR